MDADTRHQLKQNELAQALSWLRNLNDTRTRYLVLGVGLLAVLALAAFTWYRSRQGALAKSWDRLGVAVTDASDPASADKLIAAQDSFRNIITDSSNPNVDGYAKLNLAKTYTAQAFADPNQRPKGFEEAARLLEEVLGDPKADPMLRGAAMFALASNDESLRQPDKAKALYTKLTTDPTFDGSPFKTKAAERLNTMDAATANVAFAPGAAPGSNPPMGPEQPTPLLPPGEAEAALPPTSAPTSAEAAPKLVPPIAPPTTQPAAGAPPPAAPANTPPSAPAAPAAQPTTQGSGQTP